MLDITKNSKTVQFENYVQIIMLADQVRYSNQGSLILIDILISGTILS